MRSDRRRDARARGVQSTGPRSEKNLAVLISVGLAAAVLALYAQTSRFEFVSLDDLEFITQNPQVRAGLTWQGFRWSWTALSPNWQPVTWWTHMLDVQLFGLWAGGHHLTNAAFHALNSVLFFLALRLMTGALWPSACAAALFAVHPLRAESVAWLAERKDVVSGCFWMLTLLAYGWYARHPTPARYAAVGLALALGLLSKTMVVTLPAVLLLCDVWPLRRWSPAGWQAAGVPVDRNPPRPLAWLVAEKLPLLVLSVAASAMAVRMQTAIAGVRSTEEVTLGWRVANALLAYVAYLRKAIWPADLAAIYPHPALTGAALADSVSSAATAGGLLVIITIGCLLLAPRRPYLAFGWLWYLIALVPVIGIVQIGMQAMADRYTYLSMPGLAVAVAWALRDLIAARPALRPAVVGAALAAVAALAIASWNQIATWRDSTAVFERALAVTTNNYLAHASLGAVLRAQGQRDEAERQLRESLRLRANEPFTHMQLGTLLQDEGRLDEAAEQHDAALSLDPNYAQAHANLGVVRLQQGRLAEADAHLRAALQLNPGYALAYTNLGAVLLKQSRWEEAAAVLQQAVALDPNAADAHNNLGVALVRIGRLPEAATQFELVLRLKPDHANAARSLEYVRTQLGGR